MLFNSLQFLFFFPVVCGLYFVMPHRVRWGFLLLASYYFYMCWKVEYIGLILISTAVDYVAGLNVEQAASKRKKKIWLFCSLAVNLGLLFAFKYFNFVSESARALFNQFNLFYDSPTFDLLLPVGISFYTFQTLSYTIDVYRGEKKAEKHLGMFALYVAFFPQLVAGPIERSVRLLPQLHERHSFDYDRVVSGFRLVLWGFFKKLVVADRLAIVVNEVYGAGADASSGMVVLATVFFSFQIYCDFSGYSDIAIGTARILGIDLMRNFRQPYFSKSITEFWRRWHISLSTWFRDYVYIPLGGSRGSSWLRHRNLMIVFAVSGLWHGANWTFVVWGVLHGAVMVVEVITGYGKKAENRRGWVTAAVAAGGRMALTYAIVCLSWIFFRSETLSGALQLVEKSMLFFVKECWSLDVWRGACNPAAWGKDIPMAGFGIAVLLLVDGLHTTGWIGRLFSGPRWIRWVMYYAVLFSILLFGVMENSAFIYFQF